MAIQLYELCGTDPNRVFSPFAWRSRMALAHKGLAFTSVPWRFTETSSLAFAGSKTVPVLVDGETIVADSWAIAQYLETTYSDRPSLFHGKAGAMRFSIAWAETVVQAGLVRMIVSDIPQWLDAGQVAYFVEAREARFGMPLAKVTEGREEKLPAFQASLQPLRATVAAQNFMGGDTPDYADYCVFGAFMWARNVSPLVLLAKDDPVYAWRDRMLDLFGGMPRATKGCTP